MSSPLQLRALSYADEEQSLRAAEEMGEFGFLLGDYQPGEPWVPYVDRLERWRRGIDLPADRVPATFLVGVVGPDIVGRLSVRHELNDFLATVGGHIGYGVRPAFRRRGYAGAMLRHGLALLHSMGVPKALVTCDDDNVGSILTIEHCGGVFEGLVDVSEATPKRRYWIATG